jgi:multiple antibiotic resistance protein
MTSGRGAVQDGCEGQVMGQLEVAVNFFIALFALIDPVGNVPLFAAATQGVPTNTQRRLALYISLFAAGFLSFFYITGTGILQFFGISMPAFRIAGGLMLLLLGLGMAGETHAKADEDGALVAEGMNDHDHATHHFERLIVPFGMPLLIGPGAISAVVIYASEANDWQGRIAGIGSIIAVSISILIAFLLSRFLSRILGKIGMMIVVRVLGLILCAMAVQFIIVGLSGATVGFIRGSAVHPWQSR